METNAKPHIASIQKNFDPDPPLSESDEDNLWGELEDCCESEEQYDPDPADSKGALCPICIGDIIHYPEGRYEIVHRLGKGAYSVVWLARDLKRNVCVAFKVMVAGSIGEKEFLNQHLPKKALHRDIPSLNVYKDTFLLPSPYNTTGEPPTIFHRVLILPLEGPSLREGLLHFDRSLRSRMAAAKSLLEALRDLHQAGFVHSGMCGPYTPPDTTTILSLKETYGILMQSLLLDIAVGNILWKIDPVFLQDIMANPIKALGAPTQRMRLTEGEGLKSGHRVVPVTFPRQKLGTEVCLADFGILLPADNTAVQYKLQGTPEFLAPERFHGRDPSPASDMWSFMAIFVHLYLGSTAFPNVSRWQSGRPEVYLYSIWENLGPLPAEWKTPTTPEYGISYTSQSDALGPDPPESRFPSRVREDWTEAVTGRLEAYSARAKTSEDPDWARTARRLKEELRVKEAAETHTLKVIHSVFRYEPGHRLTAEQLLADPDWIKLMKLCSV